MPESSRDRVIDGTSSNSNDFAISPRYNLRPSNRSMMVLITIFLYSRSEIMYCSSANLCLLIVRTCTCQRRINGAANLQHISKRKLDQIHHLLPKSKEFPGFVGFYKPFMVLHDSSLHLYDSHSMRGSRLCVRELRSTKRRPNSMAST